MPTIHQGDCLDVMASLDADSFSAVVTDPPYGLAFMGKGWDHGVPGEPYWREAFRVLKPGGMLFAFGGSRTYHRLACAIEDAGFELRDCLAWLYGSGFPKSLDVSKAIDKAAGAEREETGRVLSVTRNRKAPSSALVQKTGLGAVGAGVQEHRETVPATEAAQAWHGYGTALKPAWEPIILAMKPLAGTFAANALEHGVAGLNVDGGRIACSDKARFPSGVVSDTEAVYGGGSGRYDSRPRPDDDNPSGRWPANVALDEEAARVLDEQSGERPGGASRFFYTSKASSTDRHAEGEVRNTHPTVKPTDLMQWLVRLVKMPTGTRILDPFCGSGSTLLAAVREGVECVGIEREAEYVEIARERIVADAPLFNACEVVIPRCD